MLYGNSEEHDMDYGQFVIMFRSIYLEGLFRPGETIKEFLDMLAGHFENLGGEIRFNSEVDRLLANNGKVRAVRLLSGEEISCDKVISTIGAPGTLDLLPDCLSYGKKELTGRMSFVESLYYLSRDVRLTRAAEHTIIFFNNEDKYQYRRPDEAFNVNTGVICFPGNFIGARPEKHVQLRVTHPANYDKWADADSDNRAGSGRARSYVALKQELQLKSSAVISEIIGNFSQKIVYTDTFTPLTIEKFTRKPQGAIYGSPIKIKNGKTRYGNLFIAGTDQGFLGIVGSMLSGISIVNHCVLLER
jgi:phytoene dehydrogenase-like protein